MQYSVSGKSQYIREFYCSCSCKSFTLEHDCRVWSRSVPDNCAPSLFNMLPPDVLAAPCLTVLAQGQHNKLWNFVFWRVNLHLDEFVERGHRVAHKPLRQCGSGDRKHGSVTAAPCPMELPFITQHQPLSAEPLFCTDRALDTEIPCQVFPRLAGHLGAQNSLYLQYSVALRCYTDAILSKHGFNTIVCLAWKFSISCASKPAKNWCNWHQKRHGSLV